MKKLGNRLTLITASAALGLLLVWLGLTAARADLGPATAPTTQSSGSVPAASAPPARSQPIQAVSLASDRTKSMPREYAVLLSRSMFVRGHAAEMGHIGQQRFSTASPSTAPSLDRSEAGLIFNGVTQTANAIDALVEDTVSGRVLTVKPGDAVASGKVKSITFDTLQYETGGRVTQVHIGQNFAGNDVDATSIPTPASSSAAPAASGASPEDILERLRQKRLQELGGGK
jgi:hypothetical protein